MVNQIIKLIQRFCKHDYEYIRDIKFTPSVITDYRFYNDLGKVYRCTKCGKETRRKS